MERERIDQTRNNYTAASDRPFTDNGAPPIRNSAEPSLGILFSDLSTDLSTLMRQEIELARAETTEKVNKAIRSAGTLIAGGLIAYAGVVVTLIAVAILLGAIMPYWLSTLIVGLVVAVIGAIMLVSGKNKLANLQVTPEKTINTLKEDARWAKEQLS